MFRELLDEGLDPWPKVRAVWAAGSPLGRHGVDVTDTFDRGLESMRAHKTYLDALAPGGLDIGEMLESFGRAVGSRLGCRFGVSFEVLPLQLY